MTKRRISSSFQVSYDLPGGKVRLLNARGNLAKKAKQVIGFELLGPRGGLIVRQRLTAQELDTPVEVALGRARKRLKIRNEWNAIRRVRSVQTRVFRAIKYQERSKDREVRSRYAKEREKELKRLEIEIEKALATTEARTRPIRGPDQLSFLLREKISVILRTYRHIPIILQFEERMAMLLLRSYVKKMIEVALVIYDRDPERYSIFDAGLVAFVDDEERVFPMNRIMARDRESLPSQIEPLAQKLFDEFFVTGSPSSTRKDSNLAYFIGKYKDAIVEITGFKLDSVIEARNPDLSHEDKVELKMGARRALRRRRGVKEKQKRAQRKSRQKTSEKRKGPRKKQASIPGRVRSVRSERNPRKGKK